jgi:hypothetical protein
MMMNPDELAKLTNATMQRLAELQAAHDNGTCPNAFPLMLGAIDYYNARIGANR